MSEPITEIQTRVLLLPPTAKDGEVTCKLLAQAGIACEIVANLSQLTHGIEAGAGALLLTEDVLGASRIDDLVSLLNSQPAWSDLPVILMMRGGAESPVAARILHSLRNVTLLECPAPMRSVLSAVQSALHGRKRQYQIRDQIQTISENEQRLKSMAEERQRLLESERAARQEAQRVNRIKDEFLATLSHELRTPLNAIFGWTQLLKQAKGDSALVAEAVEVIDRNVRAQTQLIEDLLDVSRIISGKVRLDIQPIHIVEVINAALDGVKPAAEAREIQLQKTLDPDPSLFNGDATRLQQVFWNLLTNAIKFTPKGGKIQLTTRRIGSHLEVTVADNGEGIDPDFLPLIFQRFSQANTTTKRKHGGLGLGLSIVKNLIEMHGGTIQAQSPGEGQGATFIVQLPLRPPQPDDPHRPARQPASRLEAGPSDLTKLTGIKVLIVDDDPDARNVVRRFLLECEALPKTAASAAEAQRLLLTFCPDIILSDIGMPEQDGYEFIRSVRKSGNQTPAIAVTAFARAEDKTRSLEAGFQNHLPKPIQPQKLISLVAELTHR